MIGGEVKVTDVRLLNKPVVEGSITKAEMIPGHSSCELLQFILGSGYIITFYLSVADREELAALLLVSTVV